MSIDQRESEVLQQHSNGYKIWPTLKRSLSVVPIDASIKIKRAKQEINNKMNLVLAPVIETSGICHHQ
jgi:hypothetical protein